MSSAASSVISLSPRLVDRRTGSPRPRRTDLADPAVVRDLSALNPWISAGYIGLQWGLIVGAAALCWAFWHPALYVVTVAFIGARQHDLGTMVHEAAHYRLARSRRLNDWLGEIVSWPFVILTVRSYRANHLDHHRHLNTDRDPDWTLKRDHDDWVFPMSRGRFALLVVRDLVGLGLISTIVRTMRFPPPRVRERDGDARAMLVGRVAFWAVAAVAMWQLGLGAAFALFWVVPFVTWLQLVQRLRSIAEHFAIDHAEGPRHSRTVVPGLLDRLFVLSNGTCLHGEHHVYPSVPFYRLRALHDAIVGTEAYDRQIEVTRGYWSVVRDATAGARAG